jgi:hypothetical protein
MMKLDDACGDDSKFLRITDKARARRTWNVDRLQQGRGINKRMAISGYIVEINSLLAFEML